MAEWIKLDEGIRAKLHPTRKHGIKADMYYVIRYRVDGKPKQEALGWSSEGWTLQRVREELAKLRIAQRTGEGETTLADKRASAKAQREAEKAKPTIKLLWEFYQKANAKKASIKTDGFNAVHFLPDFENKTPDQIFTAHIDTLRADLEEKGKSPQTVKHVLSLLRRVIRFGAKNRLCTIPDISKLHFEMPKVDNIKTECLTPEQTKKLLEVLDSQKDQNLASLVRLALYTGIRRSALLGLEWRDIDFKKGFITLRGEIAKSDKTEIIPMNDLAHEVLLKLFRNRNISSLIFCNSEGMPRVEIKRFLNRVRKESGLPDDFRMLHGLRHTFASNLASSGKVDLYTLQKLLTHNSPTMTQRYAHLSDEALRNASNVQSDFIKEAMNCDIQEQPQHGTAKVTEFKPKK